MLSLLVDPRCNASTMYRTSWMNVCSIEAKLPHVLFCLYVSEHMYIEETSFTTTERVSKMHLHVVTISNDVGIDVAPSLMFLSYAGLGLMMIHVCMHAYIYAGRPTTSHRVTILIQILPSPMLVSSPVPRLHLYSFLYYTLVIAVVVAVSIIVVAVVTVMRPTAAVTAITVAATTAITIAVVTVVVAVVIVVVVAVPVRTTVPIVVTTAIVVAIVVVRQTATGQHVFVFFVLVVLVYQHQHLLVVLLFLGGLWVVRTKDGCKHLAERTPRRGVVLLIHHHHAFSRIFRTSKSGVGPVEGEDDRARGGGEKLHGAWLAFCLSRFQIPAGEMIQGQTMSCYNTTLAFFVLTTASAHDLV
jgi:hypothetical protein